MKKRRNPDRLTPDEAKEIRRSIEADLERLTSRAVSYTFDPATFTVSPETVRKAYDAAATPQVGTKPKPEPWPMSVGSLYGYRVFRVDELGRLRPGMHNADFIWRPGENIARCQTSYDMFSLYAPVWGSGRTHRERPPEKPDHFVPADGCHCGFYARTYYDHDLMEMGWQQSDKVIGVIEGYGRTEIGTKGFRCEKAKVRGLYVPGRKERLTERTFRLYPDLARYESRAELFGAIPDFEETEALGADFWGKP